MAALIRTILSQNTSDVNSDLAFSRLKQRFPTWDAVADADVRTIAAAIRPGGLGKIKAPRIRRILRRIRRERGAILLKFLARMSDEQARDYLLALEGVGLKTANVVLLFALGRRVFPVDTHVLRVSRRLGLIGPGVGADRAHAELAALIPPARRGALHVNLITHGRRVCRAPRPQCGGCVLNSAGLCPYPGSLAPTVGQVSNLQPCHGGAGFQPANDHRACPEPAEGMQSCATRCGAAR